MDRYDPVGEIVAIYTQNKKGGPRELISEGFFEKGKGLLGDAYSKGGIRQVSIFTAEGKEEIASSGLIGLCTEKFHENIEVKNLKLDELQIGSKLKIGETIQEITEIGKRCFSECKIIKEGKTCALSKQVIFTKVIEGGRLRIGDIMGIKKKASFSDEFNRYINDIANSIPMGIIISDLEGNIKIANAYVRKMFGYGFSEMKKKKISEIFKGFPTVKNVVLSKHNFIDEEVFVNARTNKLRFNLSAYPLLDSNEEVADIIYIFNELKKERKLANKIMGRQAIYTFDKIVGQSQEFKNVIEFSKKIADSKSTILITGESGTGKEIFAQSIHNYGDRREEPFVAINSGAIPKNLIESELFGYVEGAFTGAKKGGQPGKFEIADRGTVFLDEIGEMPFDMQTRLLRVIEEGVVSRVGATDQKVVDVRIIAASNRDLKEEVEKGNFRRDLFYRLNVLPMELPPLRERKDDIPLLIDYFMEKISKRLNKKKVPITKETMKKLINYGWPGNVRELENFVELTINMERIPPKVITKDLDFDIGIYQNVKDEELSLDYVEKNHIIKVLKRYSGNITHSAKALEIGRNTLYRKIEKYRIDCSKLEQCSDIEQ